MDRGSRSAMALPNPITRRMMCCRCLFMYYATFVRAACAVRSVIVLRFTSPAVNFLNSHPPKPRANAIMRLHSYLLSFTTSDFFIHYIIE